MDIDKLKLDDLKDLYQAIYANSAKEIITLWAQLSKEQSETFFTDDYEPFSISHIPLAKNYKETFYNSVSDLLQVERQKNNDEGDLSGTLNSILSMGSYDLFFIKQYKNELEKYGYEVGKDGLVTGINKRYRNDIEKFANDIDFDLKDFGYRIGGITKDYIIRSTRNIKLSKRDITFIEGFLEYQKNTLIGQSLRYEFYQISAEIRNYYLRSSKPQELLEEWGFNIDYNELLKLIYNTALGGRNRSILLEEAAKITAKKHLTLNELYRERAINLNLPEKLPTYLEISTRNSKILNEVQSTLQYRNLTGTNIALDKFIMAGKPGTRFRSTNVSYTNKNDDNVSVQMTDAYAHTTEIYRLMTHELTHNIHSALLSKTIGPNAFEKLNRSIKEQLALLTESSYINIANNLSTIHKNKSDTLQSALINWVQAPRAWIHLEFLRQIYENMGTTITREKLQKIEKEMLEKLVPLYTLRGKSGLVIDVMESVKELSINPIALNDGLIYAAKDLNLTKTKSDKNKTNKPVKTAQKLMEQKWGLEWIKNDTAYKYLIVLLLESPNFNNTDDTVNYLEKIMRNGDQYVDETLRNKNIDL